MSLFKTIKSQKLEEKKALVQEIVELQALNPEKDWEAELIINLFTMPTRFLKDYVKDLKIDRAIGTMRPCVNIEDEI